LDIFRQIDWFGRLILRSSRDVKFIGNE
jgi:hypothetical protein